jgi:nucleotide-binding universal stress UspA family protein
MNNTIVAALDLADDHTAVLDRAAQLAAAQAAWLVVLHVIETDTLTEGAAMSKRGRSGWRALLKRQAFDAIEPLLVATGRTRRIQMRVEFGAPHRVITHTAERRHANLIVIGPGKRDSLSTKVLGSTADRIIRTSPASVLVVRRRPAVPYRRVAVAVDFSPQSAAAAEEALTLAPEAALQWVHAIDIPVALRQALLRAGTKSAEIENYRASRSKKAHEDLAEFARSAVGTDRVKTRTLEGEPGRALVRLSKGGRVDLLAMGPHGRGIVLETILGSVTRRVLAEAACDVLVAIRRRPGAIKESAASSGASARRDRSRGKFL